MEGWASMLVNLVLVALVVSLIAQLGVQITGAFAQTLVPVTIQQYGLGLNYLKQVNATYGTDPDVAAALAEAKTTMATITKLQLQGTVQTINASNQVFSFIQGTMPMVAILIVVAIVLYVIFSIVLSVTRPTQYVPGV